jgi:hypothetical protein
MATRSADQRINPQWIGTIGLGLTRYVWDKGYVIINGKCEQCGATAEQPYNGEQ